MAVEVERRDAVALVTVDRPEALNAIDLEHAEALRSSLEQLSADAEVRALVGVIPTLVYSTQRREVSLRVDSLENALELPDAVVEAVRAPQADGGVRV